MSWELLCTLRGLCTLFSISALARDCLRLIIPRYCLALTNIGPSSVVIFNGSSMTRPWKWSTENDVYLIPEYICRFKNPFQPQLGVHKLSILHNTALQVDIFHKSVAIQRKRKQRRFHWCKIPKMDTKFTSKIFTKGWPNPSSKWPSYSIIAPCMEVTVWSWDFAPFAADFKSSEW